MTRRTRTLLTLLTFVVVLLVHAGAASAATRPYFSVSDPSAFPGAGWNDDEGVLRQKRAAALRTARSVGATHVRIWAYWRDMHSCNPNRARNLGRVLTSIRQVQAAGMTPMISFAPVAATWGFPCDGHRSTGLNPDPQAYANFVSYVSAYTMRAPYNVRIYQTYNEPDHHSFLCIIAPSMKVKGRTGKVPVRIAYEPAKASNKQNGDVVGVQVIPWGYYDVAPGRTIRKGCDKTANAAKRLRKLHSAAVYALRRNAAIIGKRRSDLTILFGDTTAQGLSFLGWALRDIRHLDADGISVHSYWSRKSTKVPTKCDDHKISRTYLGMECLDRVRALIHVKARKVPAKRNLPVWITEGGLWVGEQQDGHPDNVKRAMDDMKNGDGVRMVNWYHIMQSSGWETWITDVNGTPSLAGQRLHAWAYARGFRAPKDWLPTAPGAVQCADGSLPDVTVQCPMVPPVEPTPAVAPNSWVIYPSKLDY